DNSKANIVTFNAGSTGTLYQGQQFSVPFQCVPPAVGDYWVNYIVKTNAPNRKQAAYKFRCTGTNSNVQSGQASLNNPPGPLDMPQPAVGNVAPANIGLTHPGPHNPVAQYGRHTGAVSPGATALTNPAAPGAPDRPPTTLLAGD